MKKATKIVFEESKSPERKQQQKHPNFLLSGGNPREFNASTITADDCSIVELDRTHIELENSRLEASGSSKQSKDTPMGDTEESHIQQVRIQKLKAGESPDKYPVNPDELINSPSKEFEPSVFTPNESKTGMGKGNREPTKAEMF